MLALSNQLSFSNVRTERSVCAARLLGVIFDLANTDFARLANSPAKRNNPSNQHGDKSSCELGHILGSIWYDASKPA